MEQQQRKPNLPPAGDARRDELKRRDDVLAEKAEQANAQIVGGSVDLENMPVENEIAQHFDVADGEYYLPISKENTDRVYAWVRWKANNAEDSREVTRFQANGWKPVTREDPEARDLINHPAGYRTVGDVMLMWMPQAMWERKEAKAAALRAMRRGENIQDEVSSKMARTAPKLGRGADLSNPNVKKFLVTAAADALATKQFAEKLRAGTVGR